MGHALDVRAGFRISEFSRARHAEEQLMLAFVNGHGRLRHFVGEPGGAICQFLAADRERQHVAHPRRKLDMIDRLGQEIGGPGP